MVKVSRLFNVDKYFKTKEEIEQYNNLVGINECKDTLVNDIGEPGELYDGATIDFNTGVIYIPESKNLKVAYLSGMNFFIHTGGNVVIQECFQQTMFKVGNEIVAINGRYDITTIKKLHLNDFHDGAFSASGVSIGKIIIHGNSEGFCDVLEGFGCTIEYDENCKYICRAQFDISEFDEFKEMQLEKFHMLLNGYTPEKFMFHRYDKMQNVRFVGRYGERKSLKVPIRKFNDSLLLRMYTRYFENQDDEFVMFTDGLQNNGKSYIILKYFKKKIER